MTEFKVGDRVVLKPARAEWWVMPYRAWAQKGRRGTVERLGRDDLSSFGRNDVFVRFDAKKPKRPADYCGWWRRDDLVRIEGEPA